MDIGCQRIAPQRYLVQELVIHWALYRDDGLFSSFMLPLARSNVV